MSTAPPNAFLEALAEPWRSPLKFLGVIVLTAVVAVGGPIALMIGVEFIWDYPTISQVWYVESGKVIGQTKAALDQRFGQSSPLEAGTSTYHLGRISGEVQTLTVTFDPSTGTAIKTVVESYYD